MGGADAFDMLLAPWRERIGTVPSPGPSVCPRCCGPRPADYAFCYGCMRVFGSAPPSLRSRVVPITSTLESGAWYNQLVAYKTTSRAPWPLLGGLVSRYAKLHSRSINALLGGALTAVTVVPSKRGRAVSDQPLFRMLREESQRGTMPAPSPLLTYNGTAVPHQSYAPGAFRPTDLSAIEDGRILLIEDSWTSGATAISAAGALVEAGAEQVVVMPIARLVNSGFWGESHPYRTAMREPYDISRWPR